MTVVSANEEALLGLEDKIAYDNYTIFNPGNVIFRGMYFSSSRQIASSDGGSNCSPFLSLDPFLTVGGNLFFPDGNCCFQGINDVAASLESFGDVALRPTIITLASPISRRPKRWATATCSTPHRRSASAIMSANLLFGHFRVDIVFEVAHLFTACIIAYDPSKMAMPPAAGVGNGGNERVSIQWLTRKLN